MGESEHTLRRQALLIHLLVLLVAALLPATALLSVPLHGAEMEMLAPGEPLTSLPTAAFALDDWPGASAAALSFGLSEDVFPGTTGHRLFHALLVGFGSLALFLAALRLGARPPWALLAGTAPILGIAAMPELMYLPARPVLLGIPFAALAVYAWARVETSAYWPIWSAAAVTFLLLAAASCAPYVLVSAFFVIVAIKNGDTPRGMTARMLLAVAGLFMIAHMAAALAEQQFPLALGLRNDGIDLWLIALVQAALTGVGINGALLLSKSKAPDARVAYAAAGIVLALSAGLAWMRVQPLLNPVAHWQAKAEQESSEGARAARYVALYLLSYDLRDTDVLLEQTSDLLQRRMAHMSDEAEARLLRSDIALRIGNVTAAYEDTAAALRLDPFNDEAHTRLAVMEAARTLDDEAPLDRARRIVDACARAESRGALPIDAAGTYAQALLELGAVRDARRIVAGLAEPPAGIAQQIERPATMLVQLDQRRAQVLNTNPGSPERFQLEAEIALLERRYLQAFYWLERLLSTDAPPERAYGLMGVCLAAMESPESLGVEWGEAINALEQWSAIAEAAAAFGFWDAAVEYTRQAGGEEAAELTVARMAAAMRRPDQARELIAAAREAGISEVDVLLVEQELGLTTTSGAVSLP